MSSVAESSHFSDADREKHAAALSSVLAAVGLTTFKIVVGLMTNSLGILAEAAHSGLDLVAALVTFFAVRMSGKPADTQHHYGHGKIENLSALFETLLLLLTCVWIIYESIHRLTSKAVEVDASLWAFLVMGVSIAIDFSRSRILYKAARKHNSQALEADALHFSTDIWSSSVVILGLIGVRLGEAFPRLAFLLKADALAALVVAGIVIYVSLELGMRSVQGLLDSAPKGLRIAIQQVVSDIPEIVNCHRVRIRSSGADLFVDIHVVVDAKLSLADAHALTEKVEQAIQAIEPKADVTVHAEPAILPDAPDE
jgi:cation diffusion facilitator family transporter